MSSSFASDIFRARLLEVPDWVARPKKEVLRMQGVILTEHDRVMGSKSSDISQSERETYLTGFCAGVWAGFDPAAWLRKVNQHLYLNKGDSANITTRVKGDIHPLSLGVSWSMLEGTAADLDLGCMLLDGDLALVDAVHYQQLRSADGRAVRHGGDAREDKDGEVDDEQVHVTPADMPAEVSFLAFYLTSYSGRTLQDLKSCSVHLFETASKRELSMFDCCDEVIREHSAVFLAVMCKVNSSWHFVNMSSCADGSMLQENLSHAHRSLLESLAVQRILYRQIYPTERYRTDVSFISSVKITVVHDAEGVQAGDDFGASIVMLDRQGKLIDGVDSRRVRSRRGPNVAYGRGSGSFCEEFVIDLKDPLQENLFVYFVVLNGRNNSSDIKKAGEVRVSLTNWDSGVVYCDYSVRAPRSCNGLGLVRISKDDDNSKKWTMKPYSGMATNDKEYGFMLPEICGSLVDILPDSRSGPVDNTAYLTRDGYVNAATCSTDPLTAVSVGVKWDTAEGKKLDLDLSCIMLTRECALLDSVHYQQLKSADGSIVHGGDTRVDKEGDADDEQIHINLKDVPSNATFLCFYLTSYTGNPLEDVETCCARLIDSESQRSLALLDCDDADLKIHSALLLCILIRVGKRWFFYNGCTFSPGATIAENLTHAQNFIPTSETVQKILIVSLLQHEEHELDVAGISIVRIHVGWDYNHPASGTYGASIVTFDREGRFVDGVDARRTVSRRGPKLSYHDHSTTAYGHEELVIDVLDQKQDDIAVYYIVLNGRSNASHLKNISDYGVKVMYGENSTESCRYSPLKVPSESHGILLARIYRNPADQKVWVVKALGHCFNNEMEYGYLLPEMKGLLTDMIPGCESGPRDFTAYLTRDELVDISTLSTDPLNRVSLGVKWDTTAGKRIDLDLGCIMLSSDCGFLDYVSYQKLRGSDSSVVHGGDTRGDRVGDVDDEQVHIALDTVPADVAFIGFYLTSYHGNLLADVNSCCARLLQMPSQRDLILLDCDNIEIKQHSSVLIGILVHVGNKWFFLNASDCSIGTALPENVEHLERYVLGSRPIQQLFLAHLEPHIPHRLHTFYTPCVRVILEVSPDNFQAGDVFASSIVMFDRRGKFIDGVDIRRVRSRRGPKVTYGQSSGSLSEEFVIDMKDPMQDDVFVYFVVLNVRNDQSEAKHRNDIRMRILLGDTVTTENCRFDAAVEVAKKGIILARIWKDPKNAKKWVVKALGGCDDSKTEYGYMIPGLRDAMSDLIPGCYGTSNDTTAYLEKLQSVDIAALSTEPLSLITVGINWELSIGSYADLDFGCLMLNSNGELLDLVNYQQLRSKESAVRHGGDSRGDRNNGSDDEVLNINLSLLPDEVRFVAFYLASYKGSPMGDLVSCGVHLYESNSRRDLAFMDCYDPDISRHPSALLCILIKAKSKWNFMNVSAASTEGSFSNNYKHAYNYIPQCAPIQNLFTYPVVSLSSGGEYHQRNLYMSKLVVTVSYAVDALQVDDIFGASIVMFDREGKFIDGVDARRERSRRGPAVTYKQNSGSFCEEFAIDLKDPLQDHVFAYFVVLNGRNDSSDLKRAGQIRVELLDGDVSSAMCRYTTQARASSRSLVLASLYKDLNGLKNTIFRAIGTAVSPRKEYGYLLPEMKGLLTDMIPGCESGPRDFTAYLTRDELVDISTLSTDPLNRVSVGVKWDTAAGKRIDLDLGCIMLSKEFDYMCTVQRSHPKSDDGSISLSTTNPDFHQLIDVSTEAISENVSCIAFFVRSRDTSSLDGLQNVSGFLVDSTTKRDIVMQDCEDPNFSRSTTLQFGVLFRNRSRWFFMNTALLLSDRSWEEFFRRLKMFLMSHARISDPFSHVRMMMTEDDEYALDTAEMKSMQISVSYDLNSDEFGAAIVIFDKDGNFIDGIDARRSGSALSLCRHRYVRTSDNRNIEEFSIDLIDPRQDKAFFYFLVLTGRKSSSELRKLGNISTKLLDGNIEFCRYDANVYLESAGAIVLARMWKNPLNQFIWTLRAYRKVGHSETEYGYLVPSMKLLMADIVPDIKAEKGNFVVFLSRDENVALSKLSASPISGVALGVQWDKTSGDFMDLDLGCMMLGIDGALLDYVSFIQKRSHNGSVLHGGDNASQLGVVDAEAMFVNLAAIPDEVSFLSFYLSSFNGHPLVEMRSCSVGLYDSLTYRPIVLFDCSGAGGRQHTAVMLCLLIRTKTGWYFQNASSFSGGLLLRDNLDHLQEYVVNNAAIRRAMTKHRRDSL